MQAFVRIDADSQTVRLADIPAPEAEVGQVAVTMEAFGVGIHDRYFISPNGPFPYVIGIEGAGVVAAVGPDVIGIEVGSRVMVSTAMHPKGGTWAESAVVEQAGISLMPDGLDFTTAAGIPVAGGTALESIHALDLKPGETLYVAGASGAIGSLVMQMAAQRGARVVGSASAPNHDHLRAMGAERAVDYRDGQWPDQVRAWTPGGVDAALAIQPGTAPSAQSVVRDGGRVITVSGDTCPSERGIRVKQFMHRAETAGEKAALVDDITAGRIVLVLEHVYPFAEALTALRRPRPAMLAASSSSPSKGLTDLTLDRAPRPITIEGQTDAVRDDSPNPAPARNPATTTVVLGTP